MRAGVMSRAPDVVDRMGDVEPTPPSPEPAPVEPVPAKKGKQRSERSPRDMALSLLVLLIPIALVLGFYRLVLDGDDPISVDPAPAVAEARAAGLFPVLEPVGLPDDWHVSTATFRRTADGAILRIGYVGPGGDPVQLVESNVPSATLLPAELGKTGPGGTVKAGGRSWQRYETRPNEDAIVLADKDRTVIIVGATSIENLTVLANALN
jgi:hypothetical protein